MRFLIYTVSLLLAINLYGNEKKGQLQNAYGICAHVSRGEWPFAKSLFEKMNEAGIGWIRTDYDWNRIEIKKDLWNFSAIDKLHELALDYNISVLPILGYHPSWPCIPWKDLDSWGKYVRSIAVRYPQYLSCMEIWNEENITSFWLNKKPNPNDYTLLLKRAYDEIKKISPETIVILGGTAGVPLDYLEECMVAGAGKSCDAIAIHPYKWQGYPEDMLTDYTALKKLLQKYNLSEKEIWVTEVGWSTADFKNTHQAIFKAAYQNVGINEKSCKLTIVVDEKYGLRDSMTTDIYDSSQYFTGINKIKVSHIGSLDPSIYPILMPSTGESFAVTDGLKGIKEYLRKGGTIFFPAGLPFYYDITHNTNTNGFEVKTIGSRAMKDLHICWETWWSGKGVPEKETWVRMAPDFKHLTSPSTKPTGRFWTDKNLHQGDTYIPIILAGGGDYKASIAGIYKLNSDLKGNVIVCSNMNLPETVSEMTQACFLPRTYILGFASGVSKMFWYNLRSNENSLFEREDCFGILHKDLSEKPSFSTYKTLIKMLPNGSKTPKIRRDGDRFLASWIRPDGIKAWAVWNRIKNEKIIIHCKGNVNLCTDDFGRKIPYRNGRFALKTSITYFLGPDDIEIKQSFRKKIL